MIKPSLHAAPVFYHKDSSTPKESLSESYEEKNLKLSNLSNPFSL